MKPTKPYLRSTRDDASWVGIRLICQNFSKEIAIHHTFILHTPASEDKTPLNSVSDVVPTSVLEVSAETSNDDDVVTDAEAIYIFQTICIEQKRYSLFYDGGCRHFCSRHEAVKRLGARAVETRPGPVMIGGVCGMTSTTPYGIHEVKLPLANGKDATMSGVCLERITEKFPLYPLDRIESDIRKDYIAQGNLNSLPKLGLRVGGETDFMLGMKYYRYFPKEVHRLPSGLAIFKSKFENADGGFGVVGGPHPVIDMIEQQYQGEQFNLFLSSQFNVYENGYHFDPDVAMLGYKVTQEDYNTDDSDDIDDIDDSEDDGRLEVSYCRSCAPELFDDEVNTTSYFGKSIQQKMKKFQESQDVGSEIGYRCLNCRNCFDCKDQAHAALSQQEEVEQDVINRSVTVDVVARETTASLPLMSDPAVKLAPNRHIAMKYYQRVVRKLFKDDMKRSEVVKSMLKLLALGFVQFVQDLSEEEQEALANSPNQNYIPWNFMFKEDSLSTPCRVVFNASMPTDSGYSLNDILAKGRKTLNSLLEIFLKWRTHRVAFHSDVQKMYNAVKLKSAFWCLQRFLFEPSLDPSSEPWEGVIKTLIYGVKSSGNQAEQGLRLTADLFKDEYPDVNSIVREDTYMDDTLSGADSLKRVHQLCEELQTVLNHGGFILKGFTISGSDPDESLSSDGIRIDVSGHTWFSKTDSIALASKEINFAKKSRGKRSEVIKEVPKVLVRRLCESKVAEVFDFSGLNTPITATWKTDLHELVVKKLDWDDSVPDTLRPLWDNNFQLMGELKNLRYKRAVIPEDAVNLEIETLEFGDASKTLVCVAIYVRFKRKCGNYSCQLILGKSRLVPETMTQPRAELFAALVNTHASQVVKRALSKHHKDYVKFTDSQIALNWICNDTLVLKEPYVRNRSIEINRWTEKSKWFFVSSEDMIADIGTRPCRSIQAVDQDSVWINGFDWMTREKDQFPTLTLAEINAKNNQVDYLITNDVDDFNTYLCSSYHTEEEEKKINDEIRKRYEYSDYIVDPNRHRFSDVVRIVALVIKYIKLLHQCVKIRKDPDGVLDPNRFPTEVSSSTIKSHIFLDDDDLKEGEDYYYRKATAEVKKFLKPSQYQKISREVRGILYYTGRILPDDKVSIVGRATGLMKDLNSTTFCVPLVDNSSPIAYSIINEVHWHDDDVLHSGVETTWRYVLKCVYVVEGRNIVKKIRNTCQRCRYLARRALEVAMGPISQHNITIAPPFYICQVDLAGPFPAYSNHNKRATIKIWLTVFCCTTTSATKIKLMDDYSTTSFIHAFTRFSCDVGYPKRMLADGGSQLIKGCGTMKLEFRDLQFKLHKDVNVELEVCPVGGHNMHGKVERRIRHIKESLSKTMSNQRLSLMRWETIAATIANSINNLPLALGNIKGDFESMDLITPNRLLLGRNNSRSPVGSLSVEDNLDRILEGNQMIFTAWFENWLLSHVPKLMEQPKWFRDDRDLKVGDIVLILKHESEVQSTYQYGIIDSIEAGRDGRVRKVHVRYRNASENVDRITFRSARSIVVIHPVDEINVMQQLGQIASEVDRERQKSIARQ